MLALLVVKVEYLSKECFGLLQWETFHTWLVMGVKELFDVHLALVDFFLLEHFVAFFEIVKYQTEKQTGQEEDSSQNENDEEDGVRYIGLLSEQHHIRIVLRREAHEHVPIVITKAVEHDHALHRVCKQEVAESSEVKRPQQKGQEHDSWVFQVQ